MMEIYIMTENQKKLMIIDHSHIFGGWSTWDAHQIKNLIKEPPAVIKKFSGKKLSFFLFHMLVVIALLIK